MTLSKSRHAWSDARLVKERLSGSEEAWALEIEKFYSEVAAELGLEMGSIGCTRQK